MEFLSVGEMREFFAGMASGLLGDQAIVDNTGDYLPPHVEIAPQPQQLIAPARGVGRPKGSKTKAPVPVEDEKFGDLDTPVAEALKAAAAEPEAEPPAETKPAIVSFDELRLIAGEACQTNGIGVGGARELMAKFKDKDGNPVNKINHIRPEDSAEFAALVRARIAAALAKGA